MTASALPEEQGEAWYEALRISPTIDFIKLIVPGRELRDFPEQVRLVHQGLPVGFSTYRIDDPTPTIVEAVLELEPQAQLVHLEVSIDVRHRESSCGSNHLAKLEVVRQHLISHLHPWDGPGLQQASRVSWRPRKSKRVFCDNLERRPYADETLYLGHRTKRWADPQQKNFAFMRLYVKTRDQGQRLPDQLHSTRVEVSIDREGIQELGLSGLASLFGFNFRRLQNYFRLISLDISRQPSKQKDPKLARMIDSAWLSLLNGRIRNVGAYALGTDTRIRRRRLVGANARIQNSLQSLTRTWRPRKKS